MFWYITIPHAGKNNLNWWLLSHINLHHYTPHRRINNNSNQIPVGWLTHTKRLCWLTDTPGSIRPLKHTLGHLNSPDSKGQDMEKLTNFKWANSL